MSDLVFTNALILNKICSHLDFGSLKAVRKLNWSWEGEARPYFNSLARAVLLPSASDSRDKWAQRMLDYQTNDYGHSHFTINTNAFSVSEFQYEKQMLNFVAVCGSHVKTLNLTVKLKTKSDFEFFQSFMRKLASFSVLEELSLCLSIRKETYAAEDFPAESLPRFTSVQNLELSVASGYWGYLNTSGFDGPTDFAAKVITMFPNIRNLTLGDDLQNNTLNLWYCMTLCKRLFSPEEGGRMRHSAIPGLEDMFLNLDNLTVFVTHSVILSILEDARLPLKTLSLRLGKEQDMCPEWNIIKGRVETLVDKQKDTLVTLELEQVGLPEWNIWEVSIPECPKLQSIAVTSNCSKPEGDPQAVEDTQGRIRLPDLFRLGPNAVSTSLPACKTVKFNLPSYERRTFERLFLQAGVATFPQIRELRTTLPDENQDLVERSLCVETLTHLFPNAKLS